MQKTITLLTILLLVVFMVGCENTENPFQSENQITGERSLAKKPAQNDCDDCETIQGGNIHLTFFDGTLKDEMMTIGYMESGYNYQAHMYNGDYGIPGVKLIMKWNDAWLSNKDCGTQIGREGAFSDLCAPDGRVDRHYPLPSYDDSGAWLTNHWTETYTNEDGKECKYSEFIKIVAVSSTDYPLNGYYYTAEGEEIGQQIWGAFAIVEYVVNDPCAGVNGLQYKGPVGPGLGNR